MSLKKATPWLVLAGSGPAADLISELLGNLSSVSLSPTSPPAEGEAAQGLSTEHRDRIRDKVREHFPAEAEVEKLVDTVSQQRVCACICVCERERDIQWSCGQIFLHNYNCEAILSGGQTF